MAPFVDTLTPFLAHLPLELPHRLTLPRRRRRCRYSRQVQISCANNANPWLVIDHGIHRRARAFARHTGEPWTLLFDHTGYLDQAEAVIPFPTADIEIAIGIDATVHPSTDPLMGAADLDTDGTNLGGWGGLNGHVSLECRPPSMWIVGAPHVTHSPVTTASQGNPVNVSVAVNLTSDAHAEGDSTVVTLAIVIVDTTTNTTVATLTTQGTRPGVVIGETTITSAQLWDPEAPHLYTVYVTATAGSATDDAQTRFGIRTITRNGHQFIINGRPLFLPGYGDDSV
jgi:hypothetical protein